MSLLDKIVDKFRRRKRKFAYRSSVTGRYVRKEYALANPDITYKVEVP